MSLSLDFVPLPRALNLHSVIDMVVTTLDARDPYTFEHSYRVAYIAEMLAEAMCLPQSQCRLIHHAAHLHDIGKIGVSDKVLNKPGKLTNEERLELQLHPSIGCTILSKTPEFATMARIVRHHHERWDGTGYPDGLRGEEIPLESRIIGLADAFDAITSHRPYRATKSHEWALDEISRHSGSQFCKECVDVFFTQRKKLKIGLYQSGKTATSLHYANIEHQTIMHSQKVTLSSLLQA